MQGFNEDTGSVQARPTVQAAPHDSLARTKRAALDEFMWTYHDSRHTGAYSECDGCTQVWMFLTDNPKFNVL